MGILVLNATGNVGGSTLEALVAAGHEVAAGARQPERIADLPGVRRVRFDYADPTSWDGALEGATRLFLMSPPGVANPIPLVAPFLEAALPRLERVVFMTADGVQYDDNIPLRRLELQIEASGVAFAHLRPNWFMQNFHTFWWGGIQATGKILVPAADARTAFVDTRDIGAVAAAILTADEAPNAGLPVSGPESLTYAEAAAILTRESGRAVGYQHVEPEDFRQALLQAGLPEDYAAFMLVIFGAVRDGFAAAVNDTVLRFTGRAPRTVADYARDTFSKA